MICWNSIREPQRAALLKYVLLAVYGKWQREGEVTNLIAGRTNHLLFSSSPAGPWQSVQTNIALASGLTLNLPAPIASGFYRVRELP